MDITVAVVRRVIAEQFPKWLDLPIGPVPQQGSDNRIIRLGDSLTVRLPSDEGYVAGITKEDRLLPRLGEHLTAAVPALVATGRPSRAYPYPWSVRRESTETPPIGTRDWTALAWPTISASSCASCERHPQVRARSQARLGRSGPGRAQ